MTNAPADSSAEREALAYVIADCRNISPDSPVRTDAYQIPGARDYMVAGQIIAAGFARGTLDAIALRNERDMAERARDEWRTKCEGASHDRYEKTAERDAAIARAEAAEAKLRGIEEADMGEIRAAHAEANASDKRAAALAAALYRIRQLCGRCAIDDIARDALRADNAALAGNGNGTGENTMNANHIIAKAQEILRGHIVPDGTSDHDALCELHGLFDGPEVRALFPPNGCAPLPAAPPSAGETNDAHL